MKKLIMMSLMAITILSVVACSADDAADEDKKEVTTNFDSTFKAAIATKPVIANGAGDITALVAGTEITVLAAIAFETGGTDLVATDVLTFDKASSTTVATYKNGSDEYIIDLTKVNAVGLITSEGEDLEAALNAHTGLEAYGAFTASVAGTTDDFTNDATAGGGTATVFATIATDGDITTAATETQVDLIIVHIWGVGAENSKTITPTAATFSVVSSKVKIVATYAAANGLSETTATWADAATAPTKVVLEGANSVACTLG